MPGYEEFNPYPYMPDEEENMQPDEERHGKHDKHHKKDKHKKHHKRHENGPWDEHRGGKHKKKHHKGALGCFLFGLFFILLGALLTKCIGKCCKNKRKRCKEYKRRMVYFFLITVEIKTSRRRNLKTRKSSFRPQE